MSTRAIAPIVGVDRETVAADIRGGRNLPPESVVIHVDADTGEVVDERARKTCNKCDTWRAPYASLTR